MLIMKKTRSQARALAKILIIIDAIIERGCGQDLEMWSSLHIPPSLFPSSEIYLGPHFGLFCYDALRLLYPDAPRADCICQGCKFITTYLIESPIRVASRLRYSNAPSADCIFCQQCCMFNTCCQGPTCVVYHLKLLPISDIPPLNSFAA
jgi:hypothetical protein